MQKVNLTTLRVRSSVTREELRVEPLLLHIERSQLSWLRHLYRMPPGSLPRWCSWHTPPGGDLEKDPGHAGVTMSLGWPGNALGAKGSVWGEGSLGVPAQTAALATRPRISRRRWMDGWMA